MKHLLLALSAACLVPLHGVAWTNGELVIWMDGARRQGLNEIAGKFEHELGIRVSIETPQNITTTAQRPVLGLPDRVRSRNPDLQ